MVEHFVGDFKNATIKWDSGNFITSILYERRNQFPMETLFGSSTIIPIFFSFQINLGDLCDANLICARISRMKEFQYLLSEYDTI